MGWWRLGYDTEERGIYFRKENPWDEYSYTWDDGYIVENVLFK